MGVEVDQVRLGGAAAVLAGAGLAFGAAGEHAPVGVDAGRATGPLETVLAGLSEAGARLTASTVQLAEAGRRCAEAYAAADEAVARALLAGGSGSR